MKVAITGHTLGLGRACYIHYGTNAVGFSRGNGYDINNPADIIKDSTDCDIFINNAYDGFAQVNLLYELIKTFKGKIINISSNSSTGVKNKVWPYSVHKAALDKASEQLSHNGYDVSNIRFGYIDTARIKHIKEPKISIQEAVLTIDDVINSPNPIPLTTLLPK
jgi:hypothetical protein